MATRVCAISFKECWQDGSGRWYSDGGFPLQMAAVGGLFDSMGLLITRRILAGQGGIALPAGVDVVELRHPAGRGMRRKLSVVWNLPHYLTVITRHASIADVVHVPLPGDIPLVGMLVALWLKKRLVARYCGSWADTRRTTLMNRFTKRMMKRFAGGRNVMLATGHAGQAPAPGVHWVFASALSDLEVRDIAPDLDRGLNQPPRVGYVGRLSPEKGVHVLVRALGSLKKQHSSPLPRVWLIGDGPERLALTRQVRELECTDLVEFTGQLNRADLSRRLQTLDFLVQPSLTEGYSKAWLDAFVHGLPVLASDVGAARHVVGSAGEHGWLVPAGNEDALGARLREVLTMPEDWSGLRRRCRRFAEQRTLGAWRAAIGALCASQWGVSFKDGKLIF